uniref:glutaminase n=1 Tax=Gouania willdenowi TaxID=441366 RepID=A0A8C5H825_GOUWI
MICADIVLVSSNRQGCNISIVSEVIKLDQDAPSLNKNSMLLLSFFCFWFFFNLKKDNSLITYFMCILHYFLHISRNKPLRGPTCGVENMLFYAITEGREHVPVSQFIAALRKTGLHVSDPRLKESMDKLRQIMRESVGEVLIDRELFHRCVGGNISLLMQAFRKKFIIPEFAEFAEKINKIYKTVKNQDEGKVANYIPQLAKFSPELWGVSLCTVDGQRHSVGDTKQPFCLQSCVKPLQYAIAVHELGTENVHRYVGMEPSGVKFNMLSLDDDDKPHNPMVNAGAIVISSLIKVKHVKMMSSVCTYQDCCLKLKKIHKYIATFLQRNLFQSEKETGDRNFAIGYYMKEKKCFPPGVEMIDALDFYFQLCSMEVTCESGSVLAATLANGGICPITDERVLSAEAVRNTLTLMHSCGMYDFSGQMAFHVGLPAKSGVSGAILLVIPNVMGMMCWSPPLDRVGNSVRGIHFCQIGSMFQLMFAAHNGDLSALRRFSLFSMDMDQKDYDSRTALHVAAAEGTHSLFAFIWIHYSFGREDVVNVLKDYQQECRQRLEQQIDAEDPQKLSTVERQL